MNNKLTIPDLAVLLAAQTGKEVEETELFLKSFLGLVSEGVFADKVVKIKGLGTFKLIPVEPRESIHVNTGERFLIPAHYKFSFLPDKELREAVNKPFSFFETTEINDPEQQFADIEITEESMDEKEVEDESVEELLPVVEASDEEERQPELPVVETETEAASLPVVEPTEIPAELPAVKEPEELPVVAASVELPEVIPTDELNDKVEAVSELIPEPVIETEAQVEVETDVAAETENAVTPAVMPDPVVETEPELPEVAEPELQSPIEPESESKPESKPEEVEEPISVPVVEKKRELWNHWASIAVVFACLMIIGNIHLYRNRMLYFAEPQPAVAKVVITESLSEEEEAVLPATNDVETQTDSASAPVELVEVEESATPAAPTATPTVIDQVVIERGSRLTLLSLKYYGSKLFWVYVYEYNKAKIADPNNVPVGTVIDIPAPHLYDINARDKASLKRAAERQTEILSGK